ncbi:MAG: VOC family protein [Xanthobacteraceae bacterium]|jgi:catechol 2,3-dioxygenase-like lactoylglutathione lyase family enzyme|nr:VOC family protein [Xanthobacteraceae bacterium]
MPAIEGVIETILYVDDLDRARKFYEDILKLEKMFDNDIMRVYKAGRSVLILFKRGGAKQDMKFENGNIPAHDGSGRMHMAFAVAAAELKPWEKIFGDNGVAIEGRMKWPKGGESIYFRDPDGNLLEFATPGLWENY